MTDLTNFKDMFGYKLIHAGTLALAKAEQVGLRIDVDYCEKTIKRLSNRVASLENDVYKSEIGQLWYKEFGRKNTNYNSDDQFRKILFDNLGYEPERYTDRGQPSVDEDALNKVDVEGVDELIKIRKLSKAKDTYLTNFIREQVDGVLHPFFNLHTVSTYRSCVAKGSRISVYSNLNENDKRHHKPIEEIVVGDYVYCVNEHNKEKFKKVLWAGKTGFKEVIELFVYDSVMREQLVLKLTPEHRVRLTNNKYVEACKLKIKQKVYSGVITKIVRTGEKVDVYDLEVEDCHNFFANEICVHNSSNSINFQNIPNRDNDIRKLVRNAVYPRKGNKLASIDFSGAEVRIGCAYHNDPNMKKYILDPTTDMHRDTVMDLYKITPKEWETLKSQETDEIKLCKPIRNEGKTFVFAEFYGDYFKQQAPRLWKVSEKLKFLDGTTIRQHLKNHNLGAYESFEAHIKSAEDIMWQERFKKYGKWRNDLWDDYCKKGWFKTLTGFKCQGEMTRNEVTNSPIQGSAFHCLLLAFIILDYISVEQKWASKLVAQIHDEVLIDIYPPEEEHVLETVKWCMTVAVPQIYKFINVPLEVEADLTPVDSSWYNKKGYEFKN